MKIANQFWKFVISISCVMFFGMLFMSAADAQDKGCPKPFPKHVAAHKAVAPLCTCVALAPAVMVVPAAQTGILTLEPILLLPAIQEFLNNPDYLILLDTPDVISRAYTIAGSGYVPRTVAAAIITKAPELSGDGRTGATLALALILAIITKGFKRNV